MDFWTRLIYWKRKKLYREYARENLNLAYGENEYGEVDASIKNQIVKDTIENNKFAISARKLLKKSPIVVVGYPIAFFVSRTIAHWYSYDNKIVSSIWVASAIFCVEIVRHLCLKNMASDGSSLMIESIVNSKVVLNDDEIEYSYSSIDPKKTEGRRNENFIVERMKYSDINEILYNAKRNCYIIKGIYEKKRFIDYRIRQENPDYKEETSLTKPMVIYDVYLNRDLFAIMSQNAGKVIEVDRTGEGNRLKKAMSFMGFLFITMANCVIVSAILFYIAISLTI